MKYKNIKIRIAIIVLLSIGIFPQSSVKAATPNGCKISIVFDVKPNPSPFNGSLTASGSVSLAGSIYNGPGEPDEGYCNDSRNKILKTFAVSLVSSELGWKDGVDPIIISIPKYSNQPIPFSKSIVPSDVGVKGGDKVSVGSIVYNADVVFGNLYYLIYSSVVKVPMTAGVYSGFGCVAANGYYSCSAKNDPTCSDVPSCAGLSCQQISSNALCGTKAPNQTSVTPVDTKPVSAAENSNKTSPTPGATTQIINPLGGGINNLFDLFLKLLKIMMSILGGLAVAVIMVGGFRMVLAQGNEEALGVAKKTITWAIIGLVVALLSFAMIAIVQNYLGANVGSPADYINK